MAATVDNDGGDGVERYREFIVDGEIYQVLDLSRRLLQQEESDHRQRGEVALLLLDRLRSNSDSDSADHVNALLRVLANHATPTKDLTEELLSLLFFCDHRVQIIHHLAKLTYQSRECVHLVLNAYIDLLASDRLLLVPILGSLAELPLQASDKSIVVDATEGLLDAVNEDDVPAVVHSLLSMLVPSSAQRVARKIRSQCNHLVAKATLALTFDVIMRHAVTGSTALQAFLRVVRHSEALTVFDVVLLTQLMARPSENQVAVRTTATVAVKGKLHSAVVRDTMQRLRDQKWLDALPGFVRFASALLAACLNSFRSPSVATTLQAAVEMLGLLVLQRGVAQEEALSLLLSIVSQPQRLLLSLSNALYTAAAQELCWDVARRVAHQLVHIASTEPTTLSPFAHIFLDHLYAIASSASHSDRQSKAGTAYPTPILESLCRTLVVLVKHEPGMVSLVMITIQKQLIIPVGSLAAVSLHHHAAAALQVKQLMAVFLADEMLRQRVGEPSDRASLLAWMRKLLSSAVASEATTKYVVRLLSNKDVASVQPASEQAATAALLATVCRRHGVALREHSESPSSTTDPAATVAVPGLASQKTGWVETSLLFDVAHCVKALRLESLPVDEAPASQQRAAASARVRDKFSLLEALFEAFLATLASQDAQLERALVCSFLLPAITEEGVDYKRLAADLWASVVALQLAMQTANALAAKQQERAASRSVAEVSRQRKRLLQRVETCWLLHQRVQSLAARLKDAGSTSSTSSQVHVEAAAAAGLTALGSRLSLRVVSAVFEGLWKQQSTTIESGLEIELFRAFPAQVQTTLQTSRAPGGETATSLAALVEIADGKRTIKYLSRRLLDYAEQLATLDHGEENEEEKEEEEGGGAEPAQDAARQWVLTGVRVLCEAVNAVLASCRQQHAHRARTLPHSDGYDDDMEAEEGGGEPWEEAVVALLAKGAVDERLRRRPARSAAWATYCELLYRSVAAAARRTQDREVVCLLVGLLATLAERTRQQRPLGELCLALLHCPFPSARVKAKASLAPTPFASLPHTLPVVELLRPTPVGHHHLVYLIVGTWVAAPSLRTAMTHAAYLVEAMAALVASATAAAVVAPSRQTKRSRKRKAEEEEGEEEEEGDPLPMAWVARDGEHRVLKNLANDSLPVFLDAALACAASAPPRAVAFADLLASVALLRQCVHVFVAAEAAGFGLPIRTCAAVLRAGPVVARAVAQAALSSLGRRRGEQVESLLAAVAALVAVMDQAAQSFQEKLAVKMQAPAVGGGEGGGGDGAEGKRRTKPARGWSSALLSHAHGKRFQRRRALSPSEAALLPYFTHAVEQLRATVAEQSGIYRVELDGGEGERVIAAAMAALRLDAETTERLLTLAMGEGGEEEEDVSIEDVVERWRPLDAEEEEEEGEEEEEDGYEQEGGQGHSGAEEEEVGQVSDEDAEDEQEEEEEEPPAVPTRVPQTKRRRRHRL